MAFYENLGNWFNSFKLRKWAIVTAVIEIIALIMASTINFDANDVNTFGSLILPMLLSIIVGVLIIILGFFGGHILLYGLMGLFSVVMMPLALLGGGGSMLAVQAIFAGIPILLSLRKRPQDIR